MQWGAWAGGGMASAETAARVERMGMALVTPEAGLAALQGVAAGSAAAPVVGANPFNWPRFLQRLQPGQRTQLFEAFGSPAGAFAGTAAAPAAAAAAAAARPAGAGVAISREAVAEQVAAAAAAVLGGPVAAGASLMEAGLDSLGAVELRNSLSKQFGLELPATLTFDYPTTAAIAGFIADSLAPAAEAEAAAAAHMAAAASEAGPGGALVPAGAGPAAALAVTGISMRLAGGVESLEGLHAALATMPELQTVGPAPRWDTGACGLGGGHWSRLPLSYSPLSVFVSAASLRSVPYTSLPLLPPIRPPLCRRVLQPGRWRWSHRLEVRHLCALHLCLRPGGLWPVG